MIYSLLESVSSFKNCLWVCGCVGVCVCVCGGGGGGGGLAPPPSLILQKCVAFSYVFVFQIGEHFNQCKLMISWHSSNFSIFVPILVMVEKVVSLFYLLSGLIMSLPAQTTNKTCFNVLWYKPLISVGLQIVKLVFEDSQSLVVLNDSRIQGDWVCHLVLLLFYLKDENVVMVN